EIPRDINGARIYTEADLDIFLDIKKLREKDLTKAEIKTSLFDKITKNNAKQKSSEEIRELEITDKFQEIKRLFDIYPELINLVKTEGNRRDELMTENIKLKKRIKSLESKPSLFKVFSGKFFYKKNSFSIYNGVASKK